MPKTEGTREQRAEELLKRIERGPSFSDPTMFGSPPLTPDEASRQYRGWAQSWIVNELVLLIPELRAARIKGKL